jgi:divalent metal cation (Fe/Co/Zn/Cd) transporter
MTAISDENRAEGFRWVLVLAVITVVYNLAEGLVATYFGYSDETLTLFGFGADSFIETISALGVAQMVVRIRKNPDSDQGPFEIAALRITGWCFYGLSLVLVVSAAFSVIQGHQPVSALAGLVISIISIGLMWALVYAKLRLGRKLGSKPVIADARCNVVCIYMSVILLLASFLWMFFRVPYVDALGSLALVYFCISEGREAFEKARGIHDCSC